MSSKRYLFTCRECGHLDPCISTCDFDCNNDEKWEDATEYEIIKKSPEPETIKSPVLMTKGYHLIPEPTPNCAICQWKINDPIKDQVGSTNEVDVLNGTACTAQGFKGADECYNSKECQKLFKAEEVPTCEAPPEGKKDKIISHSEWFGPNMPIRDSSACSFFRVNDSELSWEAGAKNERLKFEPLVKACHAWIRKINRIGLINMSVQDHLIRVKELERALEKINN